MYSAPAGIMQFSGGQQQYPQQYSQQQFSGIAYPQQLLMQPQQSEYQQTGQFMPMNISSPSNSSYMNMPNPAYGAGTYPPTPNQQQQQQQNANRMRDHTVPVQSDDERYRKQLIVNYLAPDVTRTELHSLFSRFGQLDGARVIYDRNTNTPKGYGFVYYRYPESAQEAVDKMNGFEYHGKRLKVGYSTNPLNIDAGNPHTNAFPPSAMQ